MKEQTSNDFALKLFRDFIQQEVMRSLTPREQELLKLCYGLDGGEPRPLGEVASLLNMSLQDAEALRDNVIRKVMAAASAKP